MSDRQRPFRSSEPRQRRRIVAGVAQFIASPAEALGLCSVIILMIGRGEDDLATGTLLCLPVLLVVPIVGYLLGARVLRWERPLIARTMAAAAVIWIIGWMVLGALSDDRNPLSLGAFMAAWLAVPTGVIAAKLMKRSR